MLELCPKAGRGSCCDSPQISELNRLACMGQFQPLFSQGRSLHVGASCKKGRERLQAAEPRAVLPSSRGVPWAVNDPGSSPGWSSARVPLHGACLSWGSLPYPCLEIHGGV